MMLRWESLKGQDAAVTALQQMLRQEQSPHAFLFTGIDGVGKRLAAKTLIAALLCQEQDHPCGVCSSCRQVELEEHAQMQVLRPEGTAIKISQIRALLPRLLLSGGQARFFVLIDGAELMNQEAANSLLKMLEEPPAGVYFMLLAQRVEQLLPTVRSRCCLVPLQKLAAPLLKDMLQSRGFAPEAAALASSVAAGSLGEALLFLEEGRQTLRDEVWQALQAGGRAAWRLGELWGKEERPQVQLRLRYLSLLLRDMLVLRQQAAIPLFHPDLERDLYQESQRWTDKGLTQALHAVEETRRNIRFHAVLRLALEALWLAVSEAKEGSGFYAEGNRRSF